jgi:hypothetical protein
MSRLSFPVPGSVLLAGAVLALAAGCGGQPSLTGHPVKGKVVYKGQGNVEQLADGMVRLQSTSDKNVTAFGSIDMDGTFALGSYADGKVQNVPAGQYKVRVEPPKNDDDRPQRGLLHAKYMDFEKSGITVTVPTTEELVIEVERPGR